MLKSLLILCLITTVATEFYPYIYVNNSCESVELNNCILCNNHSLIINCDNTNCNITYFDSLNCTNDYKILNSAIYNTSSCNNINCSITISNQLISSSSSSNKRFGDILIFSGTLIILISSTFIISLTILVYLTSKNKLKVKHKIKIITTDTNEKEKHDEEKILFLYNTA